MTPAAPLNAPWAIHNFEGDRASGPARYVITHEGRTVCTIEQGYEDHAEVLRASPELLKALQGLVRAAARQPGLAQQVFGERLQEAERLLAAMGES